MRRYASSDWGLLQPVDFDSRLGNTLSLYINFSRSMVRTRRFEAGYSLGGMEVGINVKAHRTKADLTELVIAMPVRL